MWILDLELEFLFVVYFSFKIMILFSILIAIQVKGKMNKTLPCTFFDNKIEITKKRKSRSLT